MAFRSWLVLTGLILACWIPATEIDARGGGRVGGRGGFSRGGGAHMGSIGRTGPSRRGDFDRRSVERPSNRRDWDRDGVDRRSRDPRPDSRDDKREERRQDRANSDRDEREGPRDDFREARRDEVREHQEYWHDRDVYVGMIVPSSMFYSYSCTKTTAVSAEGLTYTECGEYWYERRLVNGSISYVVVDAPPGH
jgi:hypothetical protein